MGNPLIAFALVAEEYEKSGDPIKGLKPLFAPILSSHAGEVFRPTEFSQQFTERYGLKMTPFVADALAERLVEIELLQREERRNLAPLYKVAAFDWTPDSIEESQIDLTIKLFSRWAKDKLQPTGRVFSEQELEDAILLRLSRPEFSSIFMGDDTDKKGIRLKRLLGIGAIDPSAKNEIYLDYLVAAFVLVAVESAPKVFKSISQIAYGSLVADAVAGLVVPGTMTQPDPPLRIVFDGPLVLDLLDLNTVEHRVYAEGLLDMVKAAGLLLAIFDHSIEEMRETIRSTLRAHQEKTGFGPLAERLRTTPGHALYANTVADSIEAKVKALGLTILPSQFYEEARYKKFFPEDRVDQVRNSIGDLHEHVEARIRDAMSVATVARLKGERRSAESVLFSGTIFITRNSVLCRRVLRALSIGRTEPDPRFTIATDGQLAGVLWFVSGITGLELSRKRLIANCSSAVLPKPEVISRIAKILNGLNAQLGEEFSALMTDRRASLCPMRLTSGIVDSIDEEKSLTILQSMKDQLVAPAIERAEAAEARAAAQQVELELATAVGKETALVLQGAIEEQEGFREKEQLVFNEQMLQFEFDLGTAKQKLEASEHASRTRKANLSTKVADAEVALRKREGNARKAIYVSLSFIAILASLISILVPDFTSTPLKVLLAIVYLASVSSVSKVFDRLAVTLVAKMFTSDRNYIAGLKEAGDLDAQ